MIEWLLICPPGRRHILKFLICNSILRGILKRFDCSIKKTDQKHILRWIKTHYLSFFGFGIKCQTKFGTSMQLAYSYVKSKVLTEWQVVKVFQLVRIDFVRVQLNADTLTAMVYDRFEIKLPKSQLLVFIKLLFITFKNLLCSPTLSRPDSSANSLNRMTSIRRSPTKASSMWESSYVARNSSGNRQAAKSLYLKI